MSTIKNEFDDAYNDLLALRAIRNGSMAEILNNRDYTLRLSVGDLLKATERMRWHPDYCEDPLVLEFYEKVCGDTDPSDWIEESDWEAQALAA
jgi:hypothetical protein